MEEVVLPDVGKFAVIGGDPGQYRLCRYRKSGGQIGGSPQRISELGVWLALREIPLSGLVLGEDGGPSCD